MLTFKEIEIEDTKWMRQLAQSDQNQSADYNSVSNYLWSIKYKQKVARIGDRYTIHLLVHGESCYSFPVGRGDLRKAIDAIREDAEEKGVPFTICGALPKHIEELRAAGISDFHEEAFRAAFDYIYDAEKLANLTGKKYHGKRNHIHRFEENEGWYFRQMTKEDLPLCIAFEKKWYENRGDEESIRDEQLVLERALEKFEVLGLYGGILFIRDKIVGITIGDYFCRDTLQVNFEKADPEVQGAYTMINREFVRMMQGLCPDIRYVNREDDMGMEGLRKSKMDYHPEYLIEKYNLFFGN